MSPALAKAFFIAKRRQKNAIKIIYFDSSSRDITTTTTTTNNNNHSLIRTSDEREKVRKLCEVAVRGGFCFPYDDEDDECRSTAGAKGGDRKTSFTFGLTDQDGKRFYGSVLKVVVDDDDDDDSVFAVLSEFRYFDTFERAMNVVREYYVSKHFMNDDEGFKCFDDEESDLVVFLVALFGSSSSSRMLSRKTTSRRSSSSSTMKNRIISRASLDNKENEEEEEVIIVPSPNAEPSLRFRVPKNDEVEDLKCFDALLFGDDDNNKNENLVPIDGIVALLIALFFERRVVLTSASLSKLSRATHAANRMVFPLKWQHVFLPVVPIGLLEYLTAPMPFLVGLPLQSMKAYEELPKEEVFLLNLDDGSYTYFAEDFELVPKRIANRLRKTLEHERMLGRHRQNNNTHNNNNITATMEETVSKAFRSFVSSAIGSYPRYVKSIALEKPPPEAITNDGLWLDQDAFVEGAPNHKTRLFRVSLRHTQMYEVFVRDRLAVCALAARSGKAQFGSDIKDADLDEESAFQAFGSEFQKEAKNVYRDVAEKSQRMAQISARSMKKGAKLVKEKFFMSFDAFKDRKTTKTLSSSSIEENGDLDWKKKVVVTTTEALDISSNNNKNDFEEEDDDDDDDATKLSELKRAEDKAKRRQRNNKDNNNLNLIDFFDEIPVASLAKETPTDSPDEAARNVSSLLDS